MAIPPRSRVRGTVKRALLFLFVATGIAYTASMAWPVGFISSRGFAFGACNGAVWFAHWGPWGKRPVSGWYTCTDSEDTLWTFDADYRNRWIVNRKRDLYAEVPAWPALLAFIPALLLAWWRDLVPIPPGRCLRCRYDLQGLRPASDGRMVCPECGATV